MRILLASIYPYVFMLLFLTIPFDNYMRAFPNILLVILGVLFPFIIRKEHLLKLKKIPTILLGVLMLYLVANAFFLDRFETDWGVLQKVLLSLALVLLYVPIEGISKVNKAIIFSSLAAIAFSLVKLVVEVNQSEVFHFLDSATAIEAVLIDRLYLGFLCVLSILVSYQSMKPTYHPDNRYYLINITINVLFILLIVSRISIIILIVIFILSFVYKKKRLPQLFFITGSLLLGIVLTFILNKDLRKEIFYARYVQNDGLIENTLAAEPRLMIWECAQNISEMEGTFWKGQGFTKTNEDLLECYTNNIQDEEKSAWFVAKKYNTHNQFIDFYLASGILAVLLFGGSILVVFIRNRKAYFPSALLITLVGFCLVENVFHRQIGAYYIGFVLVAILITYNTEEKEPLNEA